jgi:branched-chain amino acid transport system substrate-binding protein
LIVPILLFACKSELQVYRIGALLPLSGSMEAYGRNVKNGLMLALNEINQGGGIKGKKLDILFEDEGSDEKKAVEKANSLIQAHLPLIIGGVTSNIALAVAPVCEKNKVILLSPTASSPKLSGAGQYIFRNYPSDNLEGKVMAEYAVRRMKIRSASIFNVDNEYGNGLKQVFKDRFTGLGGTILMEHAYPQTATDFAAPVKQIKSNPSDGIYLIGYYQDITAILQEIQKQKVRAKIFSVEGVVNPMILEIASEVADGIIYPQPPYNPESSDAEIQKFVASYKKEFPTKPDIDSAFAYDALRVVARAISNSMSYPEDLRSRIADTNFKGITGEIDFDANGDVNITPRMFQIKGGRFVPVE